MDEKLSLNEIKESKIKDHLSLRKREYNKIINNKRKLFTDINNLFPNSTQGASSDNSLNNNNIFKILSNHQILESIENLNKQNYVIKNNLTEIFQLLFSIDFNINQNTKAFFNFLEENKIYIFLIDLLERIVNSPSEQNLNEIININQMIIKILQIIFKYSSNNESNSQMLEYIIKNCKIINFSQLISLVKNKENNSQNKIMINNNKKTDFLLYIIAILYNLSIESISFLNQIKENKIEEKIISIINNKKSNIYITDNNAFYFINFFSLNLLEEDVKNYDEDYIEQIFEFINEKGIKSLNDNVRELSLCCLCNITSLFESKNFYKKIVYSGIFDNIFQLMKTSKDVSSIIISLKIINNILTEKNIDLNYFIKSNLFQGLMNLISNYKKNIKNMTPDLLNHIISIFLYLTKSPLFYSLINKNQNVIIVLIELIGTISDQVTHDILTLIKNIIDESYRISQLLIYNNNELIQKLIGLFRENNNNNKITIMAAIIIGKILRYLNGSNNEEINNNFYYKDYETQIKEIIEMRLLNEIEINENLKKIFQILLEIIQQSEK